MGNNLTIPELIIRTHTLAEMDRLVRYAESMVGELPDSEYWRVSLDDYKFAQETAEYMFLNDIELPQNETGRKSQKPNYEALGIIDKLREVETDIAGLKKMAHSHPKRNKTILYR